MPLFARSVLDGTSEGLATNKAWRRQSSAEWAARAVTDLCDKNQVWTGWRQLRAQSDAEFHEAVEEANELHATGALFARQIEPEPPPADPVDWATAEASDDEDDAPMPDAPLEPELVDMPPASSIRTSDVQLGALRRSAPRVRRWTMLSLHKNAQPSPYHIVSLLSHVSVVPCVLAAPVFPRPDHQAPRR